MCGHIYRWSRGETVPPYACLTSFSSSCRESLSHQPCGPGVIMLQVGLLMGGQMRFKSLPRLRPFRFNLARARDGCKVCSSGDIAVVRHLNLITHPSSCIAIVGALSVREVPKIARNTWGKTRHALKAIHPSIRVAALHGPYLLPGYLVVMPHDHLRSQKATRMGIPNEVGAAPQF